MNIERIKTVFEIVKIGVDIYNAVVDAREKRKAAAVKRAQAEAERAT